MRDSSYEPEQRERDEPNRMTKLNGFMCIAINIFVLSSQNANKTMDNGHDCKWFTSIWCDDFGTKFWLEHQSFSDHEPMQLVQPMPNIFACENVSLVRQPENKKNTWI